MTKIIVSISSGKDSTLCLKLAIDKVGKENVIVVFQDTGWEAGEVYEYLQYLESFFDISLEETMNMVRGCVNEIKITPQFDRFELKAYCEGASTSDESKDEICMYCKV